MTIDTLKAKISAGEVLTADELKELFSSFENELLKLKQEHPEKYLELVQQLTAALSELNKELE